MALLAAFGIGVPAHAAVETLAEAEAAVRKLHFPVRLTLESDDVTTQPRATSVRARRSRAPGASCTRPAAAMRAPDTPAG